MQVIKRDGTHETFEERKILNAIMRAGEATGEYDGREARGICDDVMSVIRERYSDSVALEQIQDIVEACLFNYQDGKYRATAREYIVYRDRHASIRNQTTNVVDSVHQYVDRTDWRVNANANQSFSLGGLVLSLSGEATAKYWLHHVYDKDIANAHTSGDFHIHDLDMLSGYCAGWSLRQLLEEGFNGIHGRIHASPPKHFASAVGQMVNFLGTMQNEWAGAQAFSSFDTYLAPFVKVDRLSFSDVKQTMQSFIYNMNVPSRWGSQAPFTNITLDWVCPESLRDDIPKVGGIDVNFTYGDCEQEMKMINRAYLEIMSEGDANGRIFTFPIPTYNITEDFDWDAEETDLLFDVTAKYGLPYFSNFINSDMDPSDVRSMCPLTPDTEVVVRSKENGTISVCDIGTIVECSTDNKIDYQVWGTDGWVDARPVKMPKTRVYMIKTVNGSVVKMGENHLQPTLKNGTLKAKDIKAGMYLPFSDFAYAPASEISKYVAVGEKNEPYIMVAGVLPTRYYEVESVEECDFTGDALYCFEVDNNDHWFMLANAMFTHNCRLRLDLRELLSRGGGLFGSGEQTGSIGVVTLNCARLGYKNKGNLEQLYAETDKLLEIAKRSLEIKRKAVTGWMDEGLYPYSKRYLGTLDNHFSTIGVNGINEMIRNFTNDSEDISTDVGQQMAIDFIKHIRGRMGDFQEETGGNLYNLEATPAEGTTYRLAKSDQKMFGDDIIQAGTPNAPYYTNSSQLPVGYTNDAFEAIELQDELQSLYTGGTVLHLYMTERVSSAALCRRLVRSALSKSKLPYLTVTPTFSICPEHGYLVGEVKECPTCGSATEIWTRVMGYHRPRSEFNIGKASEYDERVTFDEERVHEPISRVANGDF